MPTALIVDDNPQDAYLLRCVLAADGFELVEARNGKEALERAAGRQVDVVISDILMPVMDGFSFCREWKRLPEVGRAPFVFYTATYVDKKDEALAMEAGADLFLVKPADPQVLRARVADLLARHRAGRLERPGRPAAEAPFLQQYNAVLIHKLEEKLVELEQANQALTLKDLALECSVSGILLTDPEGLVSWANASMARLCGVAPGELAGRSVDQLFSEPERLASWRGAGGGGPIELMLAPAAASGRGAWVQVMGHPVTDGSQRGLGLMLSCRDVSEEKRLRQELDGIQRLEALSLFAAGVAHDFNNLLMGIYGGLRLDQVERLAEADRDSDQAIALAAFERAKDLTGRLLTFSKGSAPRRKAFDLHQLLDESISLALSGSSVRAERKYLAQVPTTMGDPGRLAQVFTNLLVNARQAMGDRGTVAVTTRLSALDGSGPLAPGRYLSIRVHDDGPGIPKEILPRIFEPFFTTKAEGSGLGLATCQAILQEHGGRVAVVDEGPRGTCFEVLLPSTSDTPKPTAERARPGRGSTGRILVMDDQVAIQALLQRGLERAGYSVVVASNGEQALLELERANRAGRPFDLVILDLTIKGGMGGIETLARLRAVDPRVTAMATTGYADDAVLGSLKAKGFAHVLPKPFLIHELLATIRAVLEPG